MVKILVEEEATVAVLVIVIEEDMVWSGYDCREDMVWSWLWS
ncbi:rCG46033 [Rattus norvegicus]|uniref:RCG46033 n=1 Tax=Rattus norvegicus TaxID=10116 RepID=A6IC19_RAT|nr:rCG46033 [Rattus norvegicus]